MVDLSKFKQRLQAKSAPAQNDIRSRFQKRSEQTLETTFQEKDKRSKAGSLGKTIFDKEKLEKYNIKEFVTKTGTRFIDLLPLSFDPNAKYYRELQVHFGVGFAGDQFVCMHRFRGERCYRCEIQQQLYKQNNKVTDEIKALYPSDRCIYLLLDRTAELSSGESPNLQIEIWNSPKQKVHNEIHTRVRDKITKKTLDISDLSVGGEGRHVGYEVEMQKQYPIYKGFDLYERVSPVPDQVVITLAEFIEEAEANGFTGDRTVDYLLHFSDYDELKESMLTESMIEEAAAGEAGKGEPEGSMTPAQQRLAALRSGKSSAATTPQKSKEEIAAEIVAKYEKLQAELDGMNFLKWKSWLNGDGKAYKDAADMKKEEAIPLIIEDMMTAECKEKGIEVE